MLIRKLSYEHSGHVPITYRSGRNLLSSLEYSCLSSTVFKRPFWSKFNANILVSLWLLGDDERPKKSNERKNRSDRSLWTCHISLQYSSVDVWFSTLKIKHPQKNIAGKCGRSKEIYQSDFFSRLIFLGVRHRLAITNLLKCLH